MIFAHITNGTITNVIVAGDQTTADDLAPAGAIAVDVTGITAGIGWTHDGDEFIPPPTPESEEV